MPPLRRTPLTFSGGSPQPDCSGALVFDLKAWMLAGNDPFLSPGVTVQGQYFFRDPQSLAGTALSNAIEFYACP